MATFDLTSIQTPTHNSSERVVYSMEAVLDISTIANYSCTDGDIFQVMEIPANSIIVGGAVEVLTAFNGTTPTVDIGVTGSGPDVLIDGQSVAGTGYLGAANNGLASGYNKQISTADTLDVKLNAGSADVTSGKLRVVLVLCDVSDKGADAVSAARDALA